MIAAGVDADRLARLRFFSGMDRDALATLAACAREIGARRGEYLAEEGSVADHFLVIEHGQCAIEIHNPGRGSHVVATVGPGHLVGWSWRVSPHTWHFDVVVLEPTIAIEFDAYQVRAAVKGNPRLDSELTGRVAQTMARRLEAARMQLLDLYGRPL